MNRPTDRSNRTDRLVGSQAAFRCLACILWHLSDADRRRERLASVEIGRYGRRVSRSLLILVGLVVSLCAGRVASAQSCPADCSGDNQVGVNELITCVNIVL